MSWTRPIDLRAQLQKLWERGDLLASLVSNEALFPRRLTLKGPSSGEMTERFDEVRAWIGELRAASRYRIEMREFKHRIFGANAVPAEVWVDHFDDAMALIGQGRSCQSFRRLLEVTGQRSPALLPWLAAKPLRALALAEEWSRLLDMVAWCETHPRANIYLRQVDLPGVHSKFIEAHRGVLGELLDLVLPPSAIDAAATGVSQFAQRYGFRDKPHRIRFRFLDAAVAPVPWHDGQDITLDAQSFAALKPPVRHVFITENEINFLAFPAVPDSLIVFGAGYGFEMLSLAAWLTDCQIHYWGDIDTHGFAILDQLRSRFPQVSSFLMDRETFLASKALWGNEDKPTQRELPRLSADERALYDDLRDNRLGDKLRLEQERIGFGAVTQALVRLSQARL